MQDNLADMIGLDRFEYLGEFSKDGVTYRVIGSIDSNYMYGNSSKVPAYSDTLGRITSTSESITESNFTSQSSSNRYLWSTLKFMRDRTGFNLFVPSSSLISSFYSSLSTKPDRVESYLSSTINSSNKVTVYSLKTGSLSQVNKNVASYRALFMVASIRWQVSGESMVTLGKWKIQLDKDNCIQIGRSN